MIDPDRGRFNQHGGLTLIPLPGFVEQAEEIKFEIEKQTIQTGNDTPVDIAQIEFNERISREPFCRLSKEHVGGHDCVLICGGPCTYERLVQLQFALGYVKARRASRIALIMGYFFLGRSDKDEDRHNELAMPGLVTHLLLCSAYGDLDRIVSADLHAPQIVMAGHPGLITEIHLGGLLLKQAMFDAVYNSDRRPICLAFPDDGAAKRDESAVQRIIEDQRLGDLPIIFGAKRRKSSDDVSIRRLFGDLERLPHSVVLSIDDELATGKTTLDYARELKDKHGAAEVWALATHAVFCGPAVELFSDPKCPVDRIYVTDTIPLGVRDELAPLMGSGRIKVVSWLSELAQIIIRHHEDRNIRNIV